MIEDYAQVACDARQPPSTQPILSGPSMTGNHGAIEPGCPDSFKSVLARCLFKRDTIKSRMTYEYLPTYAAAEITIDLRESSAVFDGVFVNPVESNVKEVEPSFRVHQDGQPVLNLTVTDVDDTYLTDAGGVRVCCFNINSIERQVTHFSPCYIWIGPARPHRPLAIEYPLRGLPCLVQGCDKAVLGDTPQSVERLKGDGGRAGEAHHNAPGVLGYGGVDQLLHHQGGAVVHVDGVGEVKDDDLMVRDVHADGIDQLIRGGYGEAAPERHQAHSRGEGIRLFIAIFTRKETLVQQRHRDHSIEFQALELACAGHAGSNQADGDGGDEVNEDGERQGDQHDQQVFALHAVNPHDKSPIDDVPADLH